MSSDVQRDYDEYKAAGRIWGLVPPERIRQIRFPRIPSDVVQRFLAVEDLTTGVSDALDTLGLHCVVPASHIPPLLPGRRLVGTAVTLRSIPERKTTTQAVVDKDKSRLSTRDMAFLAEPGDVLVCDFGGNREISNFGGMSCKTAKTAGVAGAVVHGAVRDVSTIRELDYPVWAAGITPITGKFRIEAMEINGPVTVHNVAVQPGDLVVADDSGICFVPAEHVAAVLTLIEATEAREARMSALIEAKRPISEQNPAALVAPVG